MSANETIAATAPSTPARQSLRSIARRFISGLGFVLAAATFFGLAGLGIAALHLRAAAEAPRAVVQPIIVETVQARIEDGYRRKISYTGRFEPARQTSLAFERSGLVLSVIKDEGQSVQQGEVMARLDTAQLQATRSQLEAHRRELEAQRQLATLTLGRQSRLKTQGWSPQQRFDQAEATVAQLAAALDQVAAQIAGVEIDLAKSELRAPFDGHIAARTIDEGAVVAIGTPVLSLLETKRRQARIGLPPDVAAKLTASQPVRLSVQGRVIAAKVTARRPDLETGTRTVTVLFDVDGHGNEIIFGDMASLEVETHVAERGAWLPLTALKEGRRGLWTILVAEQNASGATVRSEVIEVLHAEGDRAFVRGTFKDGDLVIAQGTDRVVAGQRIALARE